MIMSIGHDVISEALGFPTPPQISRSKGICCATGQVLPTTGRYRTRRSTQSWSRSRQSEAPLRQYLCTSYLLLPSLLPFEYNLVLRGPGGLETAMAEKTIGIMGGMGPEAGADLLLKIIAATPARTDQEHLHVILDSNAKTPNRVDALLKGGEDPTSMLQASARRLEQAGAELLVIACNTAHLFHGRVVEAVQVPVLHIADETVNKILRNYPEARAVGVLASSATAHLRLYHARLEERGLRAISPGPEDQAIIQGVIESVKAGDKGPTVRDRLAEVVERLVARGAQLLVTGCTELPLVLRDGEAAVPVLDPTQALAEAAVRLARE
jgi:aspartate racemase